jgi:hypothetical protein
MRLIVRALLCVGLLLLAAACDPVTERRYFTEGAGVDLYTPDRENQIELQNQYVDFICQQAGPNCGGSWTAFVQAGMNDIDQRCDGFLTWLDARRRDKEPILAELSAINTATHTIMTVTGATPIALDIVTAAFGLATATYANWNSRLLISVNQSTVQTVVYGRQADFRQKITGQVVGDRPTAIYYLRNYLRICLPTTIEADINTTPTLVQRANPAAAKENPLIKTVPAHPTVRIRSTFVSDDANTALTKYIYPNGVMGARDPAHAKQVSDYLAERNINASITLFLNSAMYAPERIILARRLGLVQ